jgi:hypothetical protein
MMPLSKLVLAQQECNAIYKAIIKKKIDRYIFQNLLVMYSFRLLVQLLHAT